MAKRKIILGIKDEYFEKVYGIKRKRRKTLKPDYEPEQTYGTHHDLREHLKHGGTKEDY